MENFKEKNIKNIKILNIDHVNVGSALRNTIHADLNLNREEALIDIYKNLRPGEPPTLEAAENLFQNAIMGYCYHATVKPDKNPKIGIIKSSAEIRMKPSGFNLIA